jgi:hypothetical protein
VTLFFLTLAVLLATHALAYRLGVSSTRRYHSHEADIVRVEYVDEGPPTVPQMPAVQLVAQSRRGT